MSLKNAIRKRTSRSICTFFKQNQHLLRFSRCLFSKTGEWDPKISLENKIEIENYWQPLIKEHDKLQAEKLNCKENEHRERFYALSMFPYPSGNLHLGHVRVYTISDVMARYQRSKGKLVLHPMGWDAFGLPAENAAIERNINPKEWTYSNIAKMRQQLQNMGFSFDWSREFATCDPTYYKWTQYIFLKMHEKGLAYQKKGKVNWDPVDMTVLADEQIDENGRSWRSGALVEKKYLTQWFLRDTSFSQSLLDGLEEVDPTLWRDIIDIQKNWITDCTGHRIQFAVELSDGSKDFPLSIYTENIDLLHGVSHICVSPDHYLCKEVASTKEGEILPVSAINPVTGQKLPVIVTASDDIAHTRDARLGIPTISTTDYEVASKLGLKPVIVLDESHEYLLKSGNLTGMTRAEAKAEMVKKATELGVGGERIGERLNDWLISRQRYWGTPIPIIHCPKCKAVPVPFEDLPVTLPDTKKLVSKGGRSPLEDEADWLNVPCPNCGSPSKRETDTMDTFVDSAWYFLRYLDPHNNSQPFDPQLANKYMPVNLYVGGKEHALLHLYFARFVSHFLHSMGLLETREPFTNLLPQGIVKAESFRVKSSGRYIPPESVDRSGKVPVETASGEEVVVEWEKMSKSKHNGVNPEDILNEFGIDTTRLCILSNVSPMTERNWDKSVFSGVLKWQRKIWRLVSILHSDETRKPASESDSAEWEGKIHEFRNVTINHVNIEFERTFNINAGISRLHKYVTLLNKIPENIAASSAAYERAVGDLLVILSVMAPHFTSELWAGLAHVAKSKSHDWSRNVLDQSWPSIDQDFLMPLEFKVNGVAIAQVGVAYKDFDDLDESRAWQLVSHNQLFQENFSMLNIKDKKFQNNASKAHLNLDIPEYQFDIEGTASEKKKKKRKLSKQKKMLHTL